MAQSDLIQQAHVRMHSAAELLLQALAHRSFADQQLIEKETAVEEIERLTNEYCREANEVLRLVDRSIKENGHVELVTQSHDSVSRTARDHTVPPMLEEKLAAFDELCHGKKDS